MDLLTGIDTRSSALKLIEPGPTRSDIERILSAGARAPDHGKLAPWQFVVLAGAGRDVLANAMAASLQRRMPQASTAQLDAEKQKSFRAPVIIVVAAHVIAGHKIPESEQAFAVAAATENMFLAAQALGYGAMWKTGEASRDPLVKQALGLESSDHIIALLYLGTNATPGPVRAPLLEGKVRWISGRSD